MPNLTQILNAGRRNLEATRATLRDRRQAQRLADRAAEVTGVLDDTVILVLDEIERETPVATDEECRREFGADDDGHCDRAGFVQEGR